VRRRVQRFHTQVAAGGQNENGGLYSARADGLEQALELYYLDNGTYPSTEQGLRALIEMPQTGDIPENWKAGGYLAKAKEPKDPWGNEYVYVSPGVHNSDFDLFSLGKDGVEGGEEYDADITNWD